MSARLPLKLLLLAVLFTGAATGWRTPRTVGRIAPTLATAPPVKPDSPDRDASAQRTEDLRRLTLAAPDDAVAAVLALPDDGRLAAATALLTALADRTDDVVRAAQRLCRDDSVFVREHGDTLITILTAAGEHARAVEFAALGGPERGEWLARVFRIWSEHAPAAAATAALAFDGDDAAPAAFRPWAARDALAVARFAAQTGTDDARAAARDALLAQLDSSPD